MAQKKFIIMADRVLNEAWTYSVIAENEDEAIEMIENCPDGECEGITHWDDTKVYSDEVEHSILEIKKIDGVEYNDDEF